jgi:CheY-like chemotaxis protein
MLGFDVCRHLKADPVTCDIPVVHVSATYPVNMADRESRDSGAGRFLQHPEDLLEVVKVIRSELHRTGRI